MNMTTVLVLVVVVVILLAVMAVIVVAGAVLIIRRQVTKRRSTSQRRPAGPIAHPSGPARPQQTDQIPRESPADPWDVILGRWQNPFGDGTVYETVRSPSEKYVYETKVIKVGSTFTGHHEVGEVVGLVNPSEEPGTYHGVGKWLNPMTGESRTRQTAIRMIDENTLKDSGVQYKRVG